MHESHERHLNYKLKVIFSLCFKTKGTIFYSADYMFGVNLL
jgi:hypothetical protein